jgi:hypothetical protein
VRKIIEKGIAEKMPSQGEIFYIALRYALIKDKNKTLEWLNKAYNNRSPWLIFIKGFDGFDFISNEPEFKELEKKLGLIS